MNALALLIALSGLLARPNLPDSVAVAGPQVTPAVQPQLPQDAKVLTLAEALEIADKNAFGVRIAESNARRNAAQIAAAKGALGPRATLGANYTRYDRAPIQGQIDSKSLTAAITINIDLAGSLARSVKAAQEVRRTADLALENERLALRNRVRTAYYGVVQADWDVRSKEDATKSTAQRLEIGRKRFQVGSFANFDVLRLETDNTRALAALVASKNAAQSARQVLNNILARSIAEPIDVEMTELAPPTLADVDKYVAAAKRQRPDLESAGILVSVRELIRNNESKGLSPSLSLTTQLTRVIDPSPFQRSTSGVGIAQITWPVYDSGITKARVKQADEDVKQAKLNLDQATLGAELDVRSAYLRLQNAQAQVDFGKQQLTEAREGLRLANLLFEAGKGILLDVTTAQDNLTRAEANLNGARYALYTAIADLQRAIGSDDLELKGDSSLDRKS